ncbi:MAG: hypothetical protein MJZ64_05405 [Paludibacteraceae bacterium]|nr:hypothetical protein [Paludibacteraceae bacterium]
MKQTEKNVKNLFGFNKIKSKKNKTLLLAGLIGLMPACKEQVNEPEITPERQTSFARCDSPMDNMPVDLFMKHVPDVENVKFCQPRESENYICFFTANGDINKMTEKRDVARKGTDILYPLNFTRTDNQSVDGTAHFISEQTYTLSVSYKTQNNETRTWSIEDIPESEKVLYATMPFNVLAGRARDSILNRNPKEQVHADSVWANIYTGRNLSFTTNAPFTVQFNSKGVQQGLQHSDFGTFTYTDGTASETQMYSAINKEYITNVLNCSATSMKATAFANVKRRGPDGDGPQLVLSTGKDSARYTIDAAKNETIVMPFKNWYKVTIIRSPYGHLYSYMEDSANVVPAQWQFIHTGEVENGYAEDILSNGLFTMTGLRRIDGQSGIRTEYSRGISPDPDGKIEVAGQGYREDFTGTDRISFTFCFGGTDRTNGGGTATGLELIYCTPQRQR